MRVIRLDTVGSTNDEASERAHAGEPTPFAVIARTQCAGRGRSGRRWASPAGGVWMTVAGVRATPPPPCIALRVAIAASDAVRVGVDGAERVEVKWPNDLLVDGKKVGGVLVETRSIGDGGWLVLIGVGINADFDAGELPSDLRLPGTTLRTALGRPVDVESLTDRLVDGLGAVLDDTSALLTRDELATLLDRLAFLDEPITLTRANGTRVVGVLEGLTPDGRVAVRTGAGMVFTDSGELSPGRSEDPDRPPLG